MLTQEGGDAN